MINYICNEIQLVFSPDSTAGKVLIFSLFLFLFLFFSEEKYAKIIRRILGVYYILSYVIIFIATKNGSTMLGHGTTISKILSVIPLATLVGFFTYNEIIIRLSKHKSTNR